MQRRRRILGRATAYVNVTGMLKYLSLQDGFCWTNGVARALARLYPDSLRNDNPPRPLAVELPEMA